MSGSVPEWGKEAGPALGGLDGREQRGEMGVHAMWCMPCLTPMCLSTRGGWGLGKPPGDEDDAATARRCLSDRCSKGEQGGVWAEDTVNAKPWRPE